MRACVPAVVALVLSAAASAEQVSDDGFTLQVPAGWVSMSRGDREEARRVLQARGTKIPQADFNQISCLIINPDPGKHDFCANINMVVVRGRVSANEKELAHLRQNYAGMLSKSGLQVMEMNAKLDTIAGRPAFVVTAANRIAGVPVTIRQRQYIVPAGAKVYTLTCTAPLDEFSRYEQTFSSVAQTMTLSPGLDPYLTGAIGGLVAVLAVVIIKKVLAKKKRLASGMPLAVAAAPSPAPAPAYPASAPPQPQPAAAPAAGQQDTITVVCACGAKLRVPARLAGKKGRCPSCRGVVDIR